MQKLYLVVAELIVYRLDLCIHRLPVHDVVADNIRDALPANELPPPGSVIVLPPDGMTLSRQYPERILRQITRR